MPPSDVPDLQLLGYVFAAIAYAGLALNLALKGYLRAHDGSGRAPAAFAGAVTASALWAAVALMVLRSPDSAFAFSATFLDTARYGLWFLFLLLLLPRLLLLLPRLLLAWLVLP